MRRINLNAFACREGISLFGKVIYRKKIRDIRPHKYSQYLGEIDGHHRFYDGGEDFFDLKSPFKVGDLVYVGEACAVDEERNITYLADGPVVGEKFTGAQVGSELARHFLVVNSVDVRKVKDVPSEYELLYMGFKPYANEPIEKAKERYLKTFKFRPDERWCFVVHFKKGKRNVN